MKLLGAWIISLTISIGSLNTGFAGTEDLSMKVLQASVKGKNQMTRDERADLASAILEYWEYVESRIPKLSPQEDAWLDEEISAGKERSAGAIYSDEFSVRSARVIAETCVDAARQLIDNKESYSSSPNLETFGWIKAARCYSKAEPLNDFMKRVNSRTGQGKISFSVNFNSVILEQIFERALLSSLAEAENWTLVTDE